ncbi:TM2 domain-containing protein [Clostridium gasigenes]|uniref:TM2 domain-containing protein n=1 Tax=Clostridium gasigenes TaxID=94869 RepID=A0A7X0VQZ1_9CLOT|nr:TM2 domain-containing protein [Clostridium gasigenes]MBB6714824.1 TM2 domain-containing protein [Clostridium gasigenes]
MYCRECGEEIKNDKAIICLGCGTKKGQGNNYCQDCGVEVKNRNADICLSCGVRLKSTVTNIGANITNMQGNRNSKITAGLLALFLGATGVHRFYLGYKEIGLIQLGIFLVGVLFFSIATVVALGWALYDLVMIFTGKLTTANGDQLV